MKARTILKFAMAAALLASLQVSMAAADEKEDAAANSAIAWLALVDSNQYAESWFQASSDFRGAASREQWVHALSTVRTPLGKLSSRQLKNASYTTKLPNARPGEYVVLQYGTNYEKASGMLEVVVMELEKSGTWKLSGYFIKRPGQ